MTWMKFSGEAIFDGTTLVNDAVLITNEQGVVEEIVARKDAGDDIQIHTGWIVPGLINAHCHLELSHLKGCLPQKTGLPTFLTGVMQQRRAEMEEILHAIRIADKAMYDAGIVAVGDIVNTGNTLLQKQQSNIYYHSFVEVMGFLPALAESRMKAAKELYIQFETLFSGKNSIVPHAPYSVSLSLWKLLQSFPNSITSLHNEEDEAENQLFKAKEGDFLEFYRQMGLDISFFEPTGKTSLWTSLPYLEGVPKAILVHNPYMEEGDRILLKNNQVNEVFLCLCVNANEYITGKWPAIEQLAVDFSDYLILGTDSLASNHQLSITAEMAAIHKKYPALEKELLLRWATINGANALNITNGYGSFEKGKKPGIVQMATDFLQSKRLL